MGWAIPLVLIVALGLALRTIGVGSVPFQFDDDVSTAWATTWYYPRGWQSLRAGDASVEPNPIGIITTNHGPLQILVAAAWVTAADALGLRLTEAVWHLPFALVGAGTVLLAYAFGASLQSRRAGLLAALLVALLPLHASFSRTSGESHFILAAFLQLASLLAWWRYLESRSMRRVALAGLTVVGDMLTDFLFPGLLLALVAITLQHGRERGEARPLRYALDAFARWPILGALALGALVHGFALWEYFRRGATVGMFGRVIQNLTNPGGAEVSSLAPRLFLTNLGYAANLPAMLALVVCLGLFLGYRELRSTGASAALAWALLCSLPLLFVSRPRLVGHSIPLSVAYMLFVAMVIDAWWASRRGRHAAPAMAGLLALSLLAATLSAVFHLEVPSALAHVADHGDLGKNQGTKTAALWIRANTAEDAMVFSDPFALQGLSVAMYYYHRPILSIDTGANMVDATNRLLAANLHLIDVLVLGAVTPLALPAEIEHQFTVAARVTVRGEPSLRILVRASERPVDSPPELLEATELDPDYDARYTDLATVIDLPLRQIQARKQEVIWYTP